MVTVIDYGAGNLQSVRYALAHLGVAAEVTDRPETVRRAERLIFPGVGAAASSMEHLRSRGLIEALREKALDGTPFLGICIGMQVLFGRSEEDGGTDMLGILPGGVTQFRFSPAAGVKVPHMGWNQVHLSRPHPLFAASADGGNFYFVHSYYPAPADPGLVLAETEYGGSRFVCAVSRQALVAVQFHPEKSGPAGLALLAAFARWDGAATC